MIFICTSMYYEAYPFIKKLNLKKDCNSRKFQIFKNENVILLITGVGKIKATIAVTYLFSKYKPKNSDLFINIGVCGAKNKNTSIGSVFLCNKIIESDTKKTFYPDIIFKHPFKEASIETCSLVVDNNNIKFEGQLLDMESSGIYQAATVFLQTHQIFFIKIVSDHLNTENLNQNIVLKLIEDKATQIINWVTEIKLGFLYDSNVLSQKEQETLDCLVKNLKLSSTMKNQLKQLFIYYKLQYNDFTNIINTYINIKCKSKNEGKRYFAEIKQKLI
ncbi:5'-methylthioadenosine/S-adenosylhomocysteine nucleosidase family protein [Tepidibacter thalassicus]|uniref:Nucleoside phosphorylase n=1 Tax=Tepidibacter thalassicus DSM 15285 TaxID=1123350 RepID=A0A1M5P1M3_9FIRM|nr:hypothetical protein [Tepidibacter thalassicus]SHG95605.1 Nucleoside phosphorylase [Tepidibacter thalassicus DSM 15285]